MRRSPMKRTAFKAKPGAGLRAKKPMKAGSKSLKSSGSKSTAAERDYMGRVAALGCIVCSECLGYQDTPAIVHHIRTGQGKMRASHYDTMPLCPVHHQFSGYGVHDMGRAQFAEMYGLSELELLAIVKRKLGAVDDRSNGI